MRSRHSENGATSDILRSPVGVLLAMALIVDDPSSAKIPRLARRPRHWHAPATMRR